MTVTQRISDDPKWNYCLNLLLDDSISEVEANGPNEFFIKKSGRRIHLTNVKFDSNEEYIDSIETGLVPHMVSHVPFEKDGYIFEGPIRYSAEWQGEEKRIRGRCHIVLSPASDSPQVTIAKKSTSLATLDAIAAKGSMATEMLHFVKAAIDADLTTILSGGTGAGKALTLDTKIPTPKGFSTMGEIKVGDKIFDNHGKIGTVLKKFPQPARQVYEVSFNTGESVFCDLEHNWFVSTPVSRKVNSRSETERKQRARQPLYTVKTTAELIAEGLNYGTLNKFHIPHLESPVVFENGKNTDDLPIHPYLLGLWLGDGFSGQAALSALISDKLAYDQIFMEEGVNASLTTYPSAPDRHAISLGRRGEFISALRTLEVHRPKDKENTNKFVPELYEFASVDARMYLLQGMIDSDGSVRGSRWLFHNTNMNLLKSFSRIAASLGLRATVPNETSELVVVNTTQSLSLLPRKRNKHRFAVKKAGAGKMREHTRMITSIKPVMNRIEEMACITVDTEDSTYLVGDSYVTTHNTTFLEAMCKLIHIDTRIGIAEDTPELDLPHPNATYLHSVPWRPGMNEKDVASLSWVVAQFNRMRTDKIIIGETRGKEFADFLVAANSGMEGSLTTLHANEPVRALDKMTNFAIKGAPGTPIRSINTDIATSIDLIIQLAYFKRDSRYRVTAIQEVTNTIGTTEAASITTNRLYTYDSDNDIWIKEGNPTDSLRERFRTHGVDITDILRSQPGTKLYPTGGDPAEGRASGGLPVRRV